MKHETPAVSLPRPDGTRDVFCEASYRRVRPCSGYATFDADGNLIHGIVIYDANQKYPRYFYFCGRHCLAWFVKGA